MCFVVVVVVFSLVHARAEETKKARGSLSFSLARARTRGDKLSTRTKNSPLCVNSRVFIYRRAFCLMRFNSDFISMFVFFCKRRFSSAPVRTGSFSKIASARNMSLSEWRL